MDIMAQTFGTPDNSIRMRLISAADLADVEQSFEEFLVVLRGMAKPSMVAHIEKSFRGLLPIGKGNQVG
ncbi:hypothetical protein [Cupriavidus sp. CP313]